MAVLKVIEILADSKDSWEDATNKAVKQAAKTLKHVRSAYVQSQSVVVEDGEVKAYRVNVKVTFEIDD